jgi:hypothetical protein
MGKKLIMLDASAIGEASCKLRLFNNVVLGYTPGRWNNDTECGSALHIFRKIFRDKGMAGVPEGIEAAVKYFTTKPNILKSEKEYLTPEFLSEVCLLYSLKYNNDNFEPIAYNGQHLTELRFCFPQPFYVDDVMEILMAGTIDEVGKFKAREYGIGDLKFTSLWNKRKFFNAYQLSQQLRFYRWTLKEYARFFPDSIYATIHNSGAVVSFIDGVFHKQLQGKGSVEFERSHEIIYHDEELVEFEEELKQLVLGEFVPIVRNYLINGVIPGRDGILKRACQTVYGDCKYTNSCIFSNKEVRQMELETKFVRRDYDPLSHGE